jgi:predicted amidohydrolase
MAPVLKKYKAAAVNAEPGWFDLQESVRRTIHWIDEAGSAGCKLIAFPELCQCPFNPTECCILTDVIRDPRLPILGLESDLPREPAAPEEISREQSRIQLG